MTQRPYSNVLNKCVCHLAISSGCWKTFGINFLGCQNDLQDNTCIAGLQSSWSFWGPIHCFCFWQPTAWGSNAIFGNCIAASGCMEFCQRGEVTTSCISDVSDAALGLSGCSGLSWISLRSLVIWDSNNPPVAKRCQFDDGMHAWDGHMCSLAQGVCFSFVNASRQTTRLLILNEFSIVPEASYHLLQELKPRADQFQELPASEREPLTSDLPFIGRSLQSSLHFPVTSKSLNIVESIKLQIQKSESEERFARDSFNAKLSDFRSSRPVFCGPDLVDCVSITGYCSDRALKLSSNSCLFIYQLLDWEWLVRVRCFACRNISLLYKHPENDWEAVLLCSCDLYLRPACKNNFSFLLPPLIVRCSVPTGAPARSEYFQQIQ